MNPRRAHRFAALALTVLAALAGVHLWQRCYRSAAQVSTQVLGPGLVLTTLQRDTDNGLLHLYVVRGEARQGWRLRVAPADYQVLRRAPVSTIAAREQAIVAVNGGFFAYEGAAVGAVRLDSEWVRLPWKSRTALGLRPDGSIKIDSLQARASLRLGEVLVPVSNLNGFPGQNAVVVLTPRFGSSYKLRGGETAWEVEQGAVRAIITTGAVRIRPDGYTVVASGTGRLPLAAVAVNDPMIFQVEASPEDWKECPTILGAGPRLLRQGRIAVTEVQEEFRPDVVQRGPRTAVGVTADGTFLIVVTPDLLSGLTLPELAQQMLELGAVDALNLDGGASTALVVKNQLVVRSASQDVPVANAVLVSKAP